MSNKLKHYINRFNYHRKHRMLPSLEGGLAACGQDILVHELLGHKRDGVFIDIGANDGVTISNTLYFEKEFGWTGLAVEPIPNIFDKLKQNRNCNVVHGCITPTPGNAKFIEVVGAPNMLSTLAVHNTGLTARRLRKNAKRHGAIINEIDVECFNLNVLSKKFGISEVDFLSIDTEGGELEILRSINFDDLPVKVVSVENNYYTNSIRHYMEKNGFIFIGAFKVDEIYVFGGKELREKMKNA